MFKVCDLVQRWDCSTENKRRKYSLSFKNTKLITQSLYSVAIDQIPSNELKLKLKLKFSFKFHFSELYLSLCLRIDHLSRILRNLGGFRLLSCGPKRDDQTTTVCNHCLL